jgi:hypothetical protein
MDDLDFSEPLQTSGPARDRMVEAAADAIDRLSMHLGPGEVVRPTAQGDHAREFISDEAEPMRPILYRVAPEDLDRTRSDASVTAAELARDTRFYWVMLPVKLWTRAGWGFNRLQAKAAFETGDDRLGATTFYLLPDPEFMTFFTGTEKIQLGIDAGLKARANAPPIAVGAPGGMEVAFDAGGAVEARVTGDYVLGPFEYKLTAARVRNSGPGYNEARWRLDGAKYLDEGDPGLRVMLRVPVAATRLDVRVAIEARRYFAAMEASFQEKVMALPAALANFFRNGTPIGAVGSWDLSADL